MKNIVNRKQLFNPSRKVAQKLIMRTLSPFEFSYSQEELVNKIKNREKASAAIPFESISVLKRQLVNFLFTKGENLVITNTSSITDFTEFESAGIEVRNAGSGNLAVLNNLIDAKTKLIYIESVNQDNLEIPDFYKISKLAKIHQIPVIVDNNQSEYGALLNPLEHGAHLVFSSVKKAAGFEAILLENDTFNWNFKKYPQLFPASKIDTVNQDRFSLVEFLKRVSPEFSSTGGFYEAAVFSDNLDGADKVTKQKSAAATEVANWLLKHRWVTQVQFPGFLAHKSHENALVYLNHGFGFRITFSLRGSHDNYARFFSRLQSLQNTEYLKVVLNLKDFRFQLTIDHGDSTEIKKRLESIFQILDTTDPGYSLHKLSTIIPID